MSIALVTPITGSTATFGHSGAPCQIGFVDPETGTSFAFLTNGYPLAGYDHSLQGVNRQILLGNLGNDLVKQTSTRRQGGRHDSHWRV
jgi:CubicO group peptidase (beta-lactamase class C family)